MQHRIPLLARYVAVASLVRAADGGAAVGLIALAASFAGRPGGGTGTGGILAALLTGPQLLGPLLARPLDRANDDRCMLAVAFATFGIALAAAAFTLGRTPVLIPALCVALAGSCGPFMTGGFSAKLAALVAPDEKAQRRAEGWDAATYGMGTTVGPACVAVVAVAVGPAAAVLCLAIAAITGSALVWTVPAGRSPERSAALPVGAALRAIAATGPLRRTLVATTLTAIGTGGFAVIAVLLGLQLHGTLSSGAALNASYGLGTLAGAFAVAAHPLRGEPERRLTALIGLSALVIGLCAAVPTLAIALVAFATAGVVSAVLFAASLAVRSTYAPEGARAQVFVAMAALKTAGASAGTALAGALAGWGPRLLLLAAASLAALGAAFAVLDRARLNLGDEPRLARPDVDGRGGPVVLSR